MLLAHVLTMVDPQIFYNGYTLDLQAVQKLIGKKLSGKYSKKLLELAFTCLQVQPNQRPSFKEIEQHWGSYFNDKYCVMLLNREHEMLEDSRKYFGRHKISLRKQWS